MLTVALTGGLASGKSFVGATFAGFGCFLIKADELGHQVLLPDGEAYTAVVQQFGPAILDNEGKIERRKLAAQVFSNPELLAVLNSIVHPPVRERTKKMLAVFSSQNPTGIAVVEAAIHIETGGYKHYDKVVLAWCRPEQQIARAMDRDHSTREEVEARLHRQMPLDEKRKFADYVIDTSGSKSDTVQQTQNVYHQLRSIAQ